MRREKLGRLSFSDSNPEERLQKRLGHTDSFRVKVSLSHS